MPTDCLIRQYRCILNLAESDRLRQMCPRASDLMLPNTLRHLPHDLQLRGHIYIHIRYSYDYQSCFFTNCFLLEAILPLVQFARMRLAYAAIHIAMIANALMKAATSIM